MNMKKISENHLVNLALLESLKKENKSDELDLYIPYIANAILTIEKELFETIDVKDLIKNIFNISIPLPCVQALLTRAKTRKLIKKNSGLYCKNPDELEKYINDYEEKKEEIEKAQKLLISSFVNFSKEKYEKKLSLKDAEELIYEFIKKHQSECIDIINLNHDGVSGKEKSGLFLVAEYIRYIFNENAGLIEFIVKVVKGSLLADYLVYADLVTSKKNYNNVTVYIDAPIILGLMGFSGPQRERAYKDLLDLLKKLSINICLFEISLREIERVMDAWKRDLKNRRYDNFNVSTLSLLKSKGIDYSSLDTQVKLLDKTIKNFGIDVVVSPSVVEEVQLDEVELEKEYKAHWPHRNLEHDVLCASNIFRLREGRNRITFSDNAPIFSTNNHRLVSITNEFMKDEVDNGAIPLLVTDKWLATVLWLKCPELSSDLPRKMIIDNAYSVIYGSDELWRDFIKRLERLKEKGELTEDDFNLVRYESGVIESVHEMIIFKDDDLDDEDVFVVIEKEKQKLIENKEKELQKIGAGLAKAKTTIGKLRNFITVTIFVLIMVLLGVVLSYLIYTIENSVSPAIKALSILLTIFTTITGFSLFKFSNEIKMQIHKLVCKLGK